MVENKENKNFFKRWSDKKSGLKEDTSNDDTKAKKKRKNQILESNEDIDKKYEKMSNQEILKKLNLPDPNKVKKEEELNVFFKSSIPERLKRIAMRRLWRINPIISFADSEINDYADDFTDAANVIDDLQTSYVVGQGHSIPNIEKDLEEKEQEVKIAKNKNTEKTKRVKNKKGLQSEQKIKIKKDQKLEEKKIISPDDNLSPMPSVEKNQKNEKEIESSEDMKNQIKIKPKNLIFKRQ